MMEKMTKSILVFLFLLFLAGCNTAPPTNPPDNSALIHNLSKDTYYNTIQEALDDADTDNIWNAPHPLDTFLKK